MSVFRKRIFHAQYYAELVQKNSDDYSVLQVDYPQVQLANGWLAAQPGKKSSEILLKMIRAIAPFMLAMALPNDLLNLCNKGFHATQTFETNEGWLWLLKAKAYFARSEWEQSLVEAQLAATYSKDSYPITHAQAVLMVGQIQLNQSDYDQARKTLATAQKLFTGARDK